MLAFAQASAKPSLCRTRCFCRGRNDCDALTICHKVFGHVEGDLDGEGAGVLRGVDHGDDARADGDQGQGDLAQRTVSVAWGVKEEREKQRSKVRQRPSSCIPKRMRYFPACGTAEI